MSGTQQPAVVLLDVHLPPAPAWWPPAPGWWLLAGAIALVALAYLVHRLRLRWRRRAFGAYFDASLAAVDGGTPAQVAAISDLLRRAARRSDPGAEALVGEAWLAFLDNAGREAAFGGEHGRLLLDGGFRREVDARACAELRVRARGRFVALMLRGTRTHARWPAGWHWPARLRRGGGA